MENLIQSIIGLDENDLCFDGLDDDDNDHEQRKETNAATRTVSKTKEAKLAVFNASELILDNENDEDEFIRSQSIFSSTQSTTDADADGFKIPAIPPLRLNLDVQKLDEVESKSDELINTQAIRKLNELKNASSLSQANKTNTSVVELLDNKEVWHYSFDRLSELFENSPLKRCVLRKFTIEFFMKKLKRFNLWRSEGDNVPSLPLICLFITEINRANAKSNASVILADDKNFLRGTIHKSIAKEHWDKLCVGSVLLLQDVSIIRLSKKYDSFQLWIAKENILYVYYKDKKDEKIKPFKLNDIRMSEIETYVKEFRKTYDCRRLALDSSTSTLAPTSTTSLPKSNTVALRDINNIHNLTSKGTTLTSATSNKNDSRPAPAQEANKSTPAQSQQRVFTFKNTSSTSTRSTISRQQDSSIICISSSTQNQNMPPPPNKQILSEDQLSQLIFGLEDEF